VKADQASRGALNPLSEWDEPLLLNPISSSGDHCGSEGFTRHRFMVMSPNPVLVGSQLP